MATKQEQLIAFERLLNIMDELREKCPWDRKQTLQSLRPLTIEEVYELSDALIDNNYHEIKKELGDILLHIVFYCKIASEQNQFDFKEVANAICEKLIERHPHIYGNTVALNEEDVKRNWEKIKLKNGNKSVLEGVPKHLPSLVKATRIQEKVAGVGFDWKERKQVLAKIYEEIQELEKEIENLNEQKIEQELGDVFFSLVNYARFLKINPENALEKTNKKFIARFQYIEQQAHKINKNINDLTLEEMDKFWEESKKSLLI